MIVLSFLTFIVGIVVRKIGIFSPPSYALLYAKMYIALNRDLRLAGVKGTTCNQACVMRRERFMIILTTCRTPKYIIWVLFFSILFLVDWGPQPKEYPLLRHCFKNKKIRFTPGP